jgi:dTDP-glucose pyrophosphorylase
MANVIIPMAGAGSRFTLAGFTTPKPFINIKDRPMIEWVVENVATEDDKIYLLARLEHLPFLRETTLMNKTNVAIIPVMNKTEGAACSVLLAEKFINTPEPLIIANSDQWFRYDKEGFRKTLELGNSHLILTFHATDPKWSFAKTVGYEKQRIATNEKLFPGEKPTIDLHSFIVNEDENYPCDRVIEVAEKNPISDRATVGVYAFKRGWEFVRAAKQMMAKNIRVNGEFYVCPAYNELINDPAPIPLTNLSPTALYNSSGINEALSILPHYDVREFPIEQMWGLGTPEDLAENYKYVGT